jgi:hypothetical protein
MTQRHRVRRSRVDSAVARSENPLLASRRPTLSSSTSSAAAPLRARIAAAAPPSASASSAVTSMPLGISRRRSSSAGRWRRTTGTIELSVAITASLWRAQSRTTACSGA